MQTRSTLTSIHNTLLKQLKNSSNCTETKSRVIFLLQLLLKGIERLMKNNFFSFGNQYFLQLNRTTMGTNVACMYTTIYYSYYEETTLTKLPYIKFFRQLIDNAFIVFNPKTATFPKLEKVMNAFGPNTLKWKTEKPTKTVSFLDLTITLDKNGTLTTKTYQKEDNLYLY